MNNLKTSNLANQADCALFFYDDLPDAKLDKTLPLDLVGYALSIIRLSNKRKSLSLNISNTYLSKMWGCSVATANRKLKLLQEHRIILRITSGGEKSCDGSFYRTRLIFVKPLTRRAHNPKVYDDVIGNHITAETSTKTITKIQDHLTFNEVSQNNIELLTSNQSSVDTFPYNASNVMLHKNTNLKDWDRTLQGEGKKETSSNFISVRNLKEISPTKKRNPNTKIKNLQITFLKQALEKINEMDKLDYRFMCLLLRQVLGAEGGSIAHYGTKLHLVLRHKPDLVVCGIEGLIKSMDTIKCPIGWFIAELQSMSGFRDLISPEEEKLEKVKPKISKEAKRFMERMEATK